MRCTRVLVGLACAMAALSAVQGRLAHWSRRRPVSRPPPPARLPTRCSNDHHLGGDAAGCSEAAPSCGHLTAVPLRQPAAAAAEPPSRWRPSRMQIKKYDPITIPSSEPLTLTWTQGG